MPPKRVIDHEPAPLVIYNYQPDRRQKRPETFLRDFNGYLHVDGYVGYKALPDGITLVGCWAHAHRKFEEACRAQPSKHRKTSQAYEGQRRCDALFGLEGNAKNLDSQAHYQLRQTKAKPLVDAFFSWLKSLDAVGKRSLVRPLRIASTRNKRFVGIWTMDGWKFRTIWPNDP